MKIKLIALFLFGCFIFQTSLPAQTTMQRSKEPQAIYGPVNAEIMLKIGNGGAGPTCVLQALSEDFIEAEKLNIRIGWIQTISRFTLENLKEGIIDVSFTYEAEPELEAIKEGWASERTLVFNDHFILVGPKNNPAGVLPTDSPPEAFAKIAKNGTFLSRNDLSGANQREISFWNSIGLKPNEKDTWYITQQLFPADSVLKADREGHYTLTDRGTILAAHDKLTNTAVYTQENEQLMNRCHAMLQKNPSIYAKKFLAYLKSTRAQTLISEYAGKNKTPDMICCPLFTPAVQDNFLEKECLAKLGLGAKK